MSCLLVVSLRRSLAFLVHLYLHPDYLPKVLDLDLLLLGAVLAPQLILGSIKVLHSHILEAGATPVPKVDDCRRVYEVRRVSHLRQEDL